jgi:hypothetical protein
MLHKVLALLLIPTPVSNSTVGVLEKYMYPVLVVGDRFLYNYHRTDGKICEVHCDDQDART